jgi:pectinesterase
MRDFKAWLVVLLAVAWARTAPADITVAADGSGDFTTVQAAIDSIPSGDHPPITIFIKPGTYHEKILLTQPNVHLVGTDAQSTVLTYDDFARKVGPDGKELGTSGSYSVTIKAKDFQADNLTFRNTAAPRKTVGQAVALAVDSDRAVFRNCRLIANQDTLYANSGRQYYYHCLIEGDVDFIFGNATAVFDQCEIRSVGKGYLTAQSRTDDQQTSGYVLVDCQVTADQGVPDGSIFLGRPWRPYSRVVYLHCDLGSQIAPAGWLNWKGTDNDKTAYYAEYDCTGDGASTDKRVPWAHQLKEADAKPFAKESFLKGNDDWSPWTENASTTQPATEPTTMP